MPEVRSALFTGYNMKMHIRTLNFACFLFFSIFVAQTSLRAQNEQKQPDATTTNSTAAAITDIVVRDGNVSLDVTGADAVALMKQVAQAANLNIAFVGQASGNATISLQNSAPSRALELIARASGLAVIRDGDSFLAGAPADIAALSQASTQVSTQGDGNVRIYRCKHVNAATLVTTLTATFDPQRLKAILGPTYNSPSLEAAASSDGAQAFNPLLPQQTDDQQRTMDVILSGDPDLVQKALALCAEVDRYRAQVRLKVQITNVSLDASRDLGLQYDFGGVTFSETSPIDPVTNQPTLNDALRVGRFRRSPLNFSVAIQALERTERAKILAQPTLSLLDGERSFILIGQRLIFPVLTGYDNLGKAIYSTQEVRVGIYIQVAAQIGDDNDVVLAIYPQVSSIFGFVDIGGTRYPQISTREQQTTVRARNGELFVLGGLIRDEEVRSLQRVPILGSIPILGELFKSRSKTKNRSELLVAITPEIIRESPDNRVLESRPQPGAATPPTLLPEKLDELKNLN